MSYRPPLADIRFTLEHVAGLPRITEIDGFTHIDPELVAGLLDEAGRFASEVIAPLARIGDAEGSTLHNGSVRTPDGYPDAYQKYVEAGWPAAGFPEEWGGGGMPWAVGMAIQEMVTSSDIAFSLCPMLTFSANEMLGRHASDEQKATYLENLVTGRWSGTMVMTEPQAGSDVGAVTTRAEPAGDGSWRLFGTKIFITWGDHDVAENIVHIVLARAPGAPVGTKGISAFIVPKFLPGADGRPGERNDVRTVSLEHKLGIHASPTCVLSLGEGGEGAVGYLIGEPHEGMRYMFTMMNNARLLVGLQGLAVGERSYQQAATFARERIQGRAQGEPAPIIRHPDVRRMLMTMRARNQAMRAVMYRNAVALDLAQHHPDDSVREREEEIAAILTPVSKAWGSDIGVELASLGIQVHGGMGYVEETGAAQWWRDSRIAPIYEGTNGIQAIDLVARKVPLRSGRAIGDLLDEVAATATSVPDALADVGAALAEAHKAVGTATDALLANDDRRDSLAAATSYLAMLGDLLGGWLLLVGAVRAQEGPDGYDEDFLEGRVAVARFYAAQVLSAVPGRLGSVAAGATALFDIPETSFP